AIAGSPGGPDNGVFIFEKDNSNNWNQVFYAEYPDHAGSGLRVDIDGDYAVAGAPSMYNSLGVNVGGAYVYERDEAGVWSQTQTLTEDFLNAQALGHVVALEGDTLLVGAPDNEYIRFNNSRLLGRGAVLVYKLINSNWELVDTLEGGPYIDSNNNANVIFGHSLDLETINGKKYAVIAGQFGPWDMDNPWTDLSTGITYGRNFWAFNTKVYVYVQETDGTFTQIDEILTGTNNTVKPQNGFEQLVSISETGEIAVGNWSLYHGENHTSEILVYSLSSCSVATCTDGIKNQDETGIDLGGVCGTCSDTIQNGNETDIDVGGRCGPAFTPKEDDIVNGACRIINVDKGVGCMANEVGILSLYDNENTQASVYNKDDYEYHICCAFKGEVTLGGSQCEETQLLALYEPENSHVSQFANIIAPSRVCIKSDDGFAQCNQKPRGTPCTTTESCVASINTTPAKAYSVTGAGTNSHIGACDELNTNICCTFDQSLTVQGVNVCNQEYLCGQEDGVCPAHFVDANGARADCSNVYDSDCPNTVAVDGSPKQRIVLNTSDEAAIVSVTNTHADTTKYYEFVNEIHHTTQIIVNSTLHFPESTTTITFDRNLDASKIDYVMFDYERIELCNGPAIPCFEVSGTQMTIKHPLSVHLITVQLPLQQRSDFPYIILTVLVCMVSLVFISRKFKEINIDEAKEMQKVDRYVQKQRGKGISDDLTRQRLLDAGWSSRKVDQEITKGK
ncbi:MAG: hypothetical protein ACI8Y7_000573, partial [Candidatus Woesearchaeota archaeon]